MKIAAILLLAMLALAGSPASASPITFEFAGNVFQTNFDPDDPFAGTIDFGTEFSGSFTFESTATDADPSAEGGSYTSPVGTPYEFSVTIGGNPFATSDFLNIGVGNDFAGPTDFYTVLACTSDAACTAELTLEIFLQDDHAVVFASDDLPTDNFSLAAFEVARFTLRGSVEDNQVEIIGDLTALRCVEGCVPFGVPEPSTLLLLAAGVFALASLRRTS